MNFPYFIFRNTINKTFIFSCALLLLTSNLHSQSKLEIKSYFFDAESWILFEDYPEALVIYKQLLKIDPKNANYKYRIGQCYINTPGEKEKALSYLEEAVQDLNPKYKEGKFKERKICGECLMYFILSLSE
ncbi:MAG TPA: tetratricopeptide repeat protein [Bacteroidales bacterium]|nr:tetratricopeptide repeat protein [Bacteroidales bacterium]